MGISKHTTFRGIAVEVTRTRPKAEERDPKKFYLDLRHSETDWTQPVTVERSVWANYWGTIISDELIEVPPPPDDFSPLKRRERHHFRDLGL